MRTRPIGNAEEGHSRARLLSSGILPFPLERSPSALRLSLGLSQRLVLSSLGLALFRLLLNRQLVRLSLRCQSSLLRGLLVCLTLACRAMHRLALPPRHRPFLHGTKMDPRFIDAEPQGTVERTSERTRK
jgi:hypothetical protein